MAVAVAGHAGGRVSMNSKACKALTSMHTLERYPACSAVPCLASQQGPTASMGLYVDSGSIYETQQTTGERQLGYVRGAASWTVAAWPVSRSPQAGSKHEPATQQSELKSYVCLHPARRCHCYVGVSSLQGLPAQGHPAYHEGGAQLSWLRGNISRSKSWCSVFLATAATTRVQQQQQRLPPS